jgi:dihydropteroate synthase
VVGIVNVTPDSFSDGGDFFSPDAAVAHGRQLVADGADILDIGGESTRPNASPVLLSEEMRRIVPVIRGLRLAVPDIPLSIDTVKAPVAEGAIAFGAAIVNDVSGLRLDPDMGPLCASSGVGVVLMHSRGSVADMAAYTHAEYVDVVGEVTTELRSRVSAARDAGIDDRSIVLDPGIGFSKRTEHSISLLANLPEIAALGLPVLVGVSRKRFIGEITGVTTTADREEGTMAANVVALTLGARLFRVHDVRAARRSLDLAWEIMRRMR